MGVDNNNNLSSPEQSDQPCCDGTTLQQLVQQHEAQPNSRGGHHTQQYMCQVGSYRDKLRITNDDRIGSALAASPQF